MIATIYNSKKQTPVSSSSLLSREDAAVVADGFRHRLPVNAAIERHLGGVVNDTLAHTGSLARAHLAYRLMTSLDFNENDALNIGVAIEYFHTASLLLDDLPCMDNATMRRGHACAHTVHGESAAILGALSLITQGYALLWSSLNDLPSEQRLTASALVNECLGMNGILNGQAYDLFFAESERAESDVLRIATGKTVTLIRLTLLLPALMRGVDEATRNTLDQLSLHWGLAYQILDDFKDGLMSAAETGKTTARDASLDHPNLPRVMGVGKAAVVLGEKLDQSRSCLQALARQLPDVSVLQRLQALLEDDYATVRTRLAAMDGRLAAACM